MADLETLKLPHRGVDFKIVDIEKNAPVAIVAATFGAKDLFLSGRIVNDSAKAVSGYRIGWVFQFGNGSMVFGAGLWLEVSTGIRPGAFQNVPALNVSSHVLADSGVRRVAFFVAEVKYANGSHWKASLKGLRLAPATQAHQESSLR